MCELIVYVYACAFVIWFSIAFVVLHFELQLMYDFRDSW